MIVCRHMQLCGVMGTRQLQLGFYQALPCMCGSTELMLMPSL